MPCRSTQETAAIEDTSLNAAVDLLDAMEQVECDTDLYYYTKRYLPDKENKKLFM